MTPLYLPDTVLDGLDIAPPQIADAIEDALHAKASGRLHVAPKSAILPGDGRYMMSTLAVGDDGYVVVKQVSVCPDNPQSGLPAINGSIMVLDAKTGLLRALVGANWITAYRTAALSAVAARRLGNPHASTIAFVGAGVQARSHLEAFQAIFPLRRAFVFGRSRSTLDKFCEFAREKGVEAEVAATPKDAISQADVIVTSITLDYSVEPFLDAGWLRSNAFAAITDLGIPWIDETMSAFSTIVIDDKQQEAESPKPLVPSNMVTADLTELVAEGVPDAEGPKAFAFRGIALGDYAASVLALRIAETNGQGILIAP